MGVQVCYNVGAFPLRKLQIHQLRKQKKSAIFTKLRNGVNLYRKRMDAQWCCTVCAFPIRKPQIHQFRKNANCDFYEIAKWCKSAGGTKCDYNVVAMLAYFL